MLTLNEILDSNEFVLIDGSLRGSESICDYLYEVHKLEELDKQKIENIEREFKKIQYIISQPHATTIPEVAREIKVCAEIIGVNLRYISEFEKILKTKPRSRTGCKKNHQEYKKPEKNRQVLKRLQETVFSTYEAFRERETKIRDRKYTLLAEMVREIDLAIGLKQDTSHLYGLPKKDPTSSDTDEKLVAALYYKSLFSNTPPVLLTKDTDFVRLLGVTPRLLGSDDFMPYNQSFRTRMVDNPFKLYIFQEHTDIYNPALTSKSYLNFDPEFILGNIPKLKSDKIKQKIQFLWQQFSGN